MEIGNLNNIGEWATAVLINEVPSSGVFACQPTDDVNDADCWPIWTIVLEDGVVVHQVPLYSSPHGGYDFMDMLGWDKRRLAEWTQYERANGAEEAHTICRVG